MYVIRHPNIRPLEDLQPSGQPHLLPILESVFLIAGEFIPCFT